MDKEKRLVVNQVTDGTVGSVTGINNGTIEVRVTSGEADRQSLAAEKRKEKPAAEVEHKDPRVLISHASEDREYARRVAYLLDAIGVPEKAIVCSSVPEYSIPEGEDIYGWLRNQFIASDLRVIFLLSHKYYQKAACLNEMGAAWVIQSRHNIVLLPGFSVQDMHGCIDRNKIATVLDGNEEEIRHRLGEIKAQLETQFSLEPVGAEKWERLRGEFIRDIREIGSTGKN